MNQKVKYSPREIKLMLKENPFDVRVVTQKALEYIEKMKHKNGASKTN